MKTLKPTPELIAAMDDMKAVIGRDEPLKNGVAHIAARLAREQGAK